MPINYMAAMNYTAAGPFRQHHRRRGNPPSPPGQPAGPRSTAL